MVTTIDSAGRIVVPKRLREELGFKPGQELELSAVDGRLEIEHQATPMRLERRGERMVLPESERRTLVKRLASISISGGSAYDAGVAATAGHHGRTLLSCDRRAARTYEKLGVDVIHL